MWLTTFCFHYSYRHELSSVWANFESNLDLVYGCRWREVKLKYCLPKLPCCFTLDCSDCPYLFSHGKQHFLKWSSELQKKKKPTLALGNLHVFVWHRDCCWCSLKVQLSTIIGLFVCFRGWGFPYSGSGAMYFLFGSPPPKFLFPAFH